MTIVVVSYNTRQMTIDCLRSIVEQTTVPFELIVVDNASSDGSAAAIEAQFPDVRLLAESENHGFAKANNIAAAGASGDLLLLLNPDTVVLDRAIDEIVAFAHRHPSARIWGGRTIFADESLNPSNCWRRMSLWNILCRTTCLDRAFSHSPVFNREAYGGWNRDSERDVDIVSGCFFLIDRALWDELDGFDLTYVMYGEEADLCLRACTRGAHPRVTPSAEIIHHGGASERVSSDRLRRLLNAKITLIRRHFPTWQQPVALALFRLWPLSRFVVARVTVLSRLPRRPSARETLETWSQVWSQRVDWWNGYRTVDRTVHQ